MKRIYRRLLLLIACIPALFTAHAAYYREAYVYFDGTGWSQPNVYCCVGRQQWGNDWTNLFKMRKIANTQLYYVQTAEFNTATYMAFIGTERPWGEGNWAQGNLPNAQEYTAESNYVLNWHDYYLFTRNGSYNGASISGNYMGDSFSGAQDGLNHTQTICSYISEDKGGSYQEAPFPAKAIISSYELSSFPSTTQLVSETLLLSDNQSRCQIPAVYTATVTCTIDMTGINDYVFVGWYDNAGRLVSTDYSYSYTASRETRTYEARFKRKVYRLVSSLQDGSQLYSNEVWNSGDIMSVYTQSEGNIQLQCTGVEGWENVGDPVNHTEDNVIVAPLEVSEGVASMGTISNYTGNYYVRTDVAAGGWNNYKQEGNQFTYFEPNPLFANETYNHYWVTKINSGNCKARIANDYNNSLAPEIGDYNVTENRETNLRFSYNNTTNVFERTFMSGSTSNDFLLIYGTDINTTTGGSMDVSAKQRFTDISNWVYEYDLKASPGATINIESNYPYQTTKSIVQNAIILGENSTQNGSIQYDMRVIYDFKKNRWVASWLPNVGDITINDQEIDVYANMMFVRKHNEPVNFIKITGNGYIDHLQRIYFVMELEKEKCLSGKSSDKLFWFSLPYNCKISDIFGIEGYGKKWVIQRYRGDKRAELSWTTNIKTFWANMKSTATLEANQGYVLALNLTASDFQDIGGKSVLRLYFPSDESNFKLSKNSNMTVTIPEHKCTVSVRDSVDSNWNVIGIPGFQPVNMQSYAEANGFDGFKDNKVPNFLYEWGGENGLYHVKDGKTMTYQHFYSYMVQFAGTINWGQFTQGNTGTPASVRAQRSSQANREETFRIDLTGESNADRTFVRLSDNGTEGYVPNQDLEKLINGQYAQIYSLGAGTHLAANTLPRETQTVPLGLNIPSYGNYTLSLDENGQSVTAILYDKWENVSTDLSRNSYEFTQMEGRCEDRFEIQFSAEPTVPTDVEEAREAFIRVDGRTLRVVGGHEGGCVAVYDMAGRCLLSTQLTADFSFEVPVAGVYVVEYQGERNKVVIR